MTPREYLNGNGFLKAWLPIILTALSLLIAGLGAFANVKSDVRNVTTTLESHERTQQLQRSEDRERLQRIEDKLDQALGRK